jgi:transcriptional regulator with XRE-family HTH domain
MDLSATGIAPASERAETRKHERPGQAQPAAALWPWTSVRTWRADCPVIERTCRFGTIGVRRNIHMGDDIDLHLGKRLRRRRRLLGLTQQQLAGSCGVRFQQIQKYECGANRISAARLWQLSEALEVPVGYFFDGLSEAERGQRLNGDAEGGGEILARKETLDLIRAYYQLGERPRRRLLDLAKSLNGESDAA